jgi:hypothetical protein
MPLLSNDEALSAHHYKVTTMPCYLHATLSKQQSFTIYTLLLSNDEAISSAHHHKVMTKPCYLHATAT